MIRLCRLSLVGSLFLISIFANAQYRKPKVGLIPYNIDIEQVDYYENSTIVSVSMKSERDVSWMSINDESYERALVGQHGFYHYVMSINEDAYALSKSGKKYPLVKSVNLPIKTEAENKCMLFDFEGQVHHFALEFAKMPEGEKFDIIEDANSSNAFNIYGIAPDTLSRHDKMNLDEFVADYPVKERAVVVQDDEYVFSVKYKGVELSMYMQTVKEHGKYYQVAFDLKNMSGDSIRLASENITAIGYRANKKKQQLDIIPLKVYDYEEIDERIRGGRTGEEFWTAFRERKAASSSSPSVDTHAVALSPSVQEANANINAYASFQPQTVEQVCDGYMNNGVIRNGVEYSGFINIGYEKTDHVRVIFKINGADFPFVI